MGGGDASLDRDLFGDGEVVPLRVRPVDQPQGLRLLADVGLELDPVAEKPIDLAVSVIQEPVGASAGALELEDRAIGQSELVALSAD